jgi:GNAT superfamily N-acetyltransferase
MNLTVQTLTTAAEVAALEPLAQELVASALAEERDEGAPAGAGRAVLERALASPCGLVLRALGEDGSDAGLLVCGPLLDPLAGDERPMIQLLWAAPAYRRRGLARGLVDQASKTLRARGHRTLAARVGHNDDALISMGERWGFVRSYELLVRDE